ncbi:MAG: hypothetical protein ACXQTI_03565 [Candidatus Nezhaarchaeales archaeon]
MDDTMLRRAILLREGNVIPFKRRIAKVSTKYYVINLPSALRTLWEFLYEKRIPVNVYIEIPRDEDEQAGKG